MSVLPPALTPSTSVLLVIDIQDRLLPAIHEGQALVEASCRMIEAAKVLDVPALLAEQYPAGLGPTCAPVRECLPAEVGAVEKTRFSGCVQEIVDHLGRLGRHAVIIVGIESHVCVLQTALDLLRMGYLPYVCADAVSSRRPVDRDMALQRMRQAGAVVTTTESVIFELCGEVGTETFKRLLPIVK